MSSATHAHHRLAMAAFVLEVFLSLGALFGGGVLMVGPRGEILPLPVSALSGSPFRDYFWPGLILFVVLGVVPAFVAFLAWNHQRLAPLLTVGVGLALIGWLVVEIAIIGYSNHPPLQLFYLVLGVVIAGVGALWMQRHAQR